MAWRLNLFRLGREKRDFKKTTIKLATGNWQ
jgi:hypothetical protein